MNVNVLNRSGVQAAASSRVATLTATSIRGRRESGSAASASHCIRICRSAGWTMSRNSALPTASRGRRDQRTRRANRSVPPRRLLPTAGRREAIYASWRSSTGPEQRLIGYPQPLTSGRERPRGAVGGDHLCHQRVAEGRVDLAGQAAARLRRDPLRGQCRVGAGNRTARR